MNWFMELFCKQIKHESVVKYVILASLYSRIHSIVKMPIYREGFECHTIEQLETKLEILKEGGWEIDQIVTLKDEV